MNVKSQKTPNIRRSPPPKQELSILFGMAHAGFFRNFEGVIARLLAANIDVHLHFSKHHKTISMDDYCLPAMQANGHLTISVGDTSSDTVLDTVARIRIMRDIIHYSRPAYKEASDLRARFPKLQRSDALSEKAQARLHRISAWLPGFMKETVDRYLIKKEKQIPPNSGAVKLVKKIKPDYVIVTPMVNFSSREIDLVKAAHEQGIPTLLATASWDNLTNKGRIKIQPHRVAVWNRHMAREAIELHGVMPESIWITGAPPFDHWFGRKPSRNRAIFCRSLCLNPARPIIVYLCSSESIAGKQEFATVKGWIAALRESNVKILAKANILVRPHPMALQGWNRLLPDVSSDVGEIWGAKVWPFRGTHPVTDESRNDFFDTLYHAEAVVGLNTSAMIEAAILGKPVLTFLEHGVTESQTGNLHFQYLAKGGFTFQAKAIEEHVRQLSTVIENHEGVAEACERFVSDFVRPFGTEVTASARLADLIIDDMQRQLKSCN